MFGIDAREATAVLEGQMIKIRGAEALTTGAFDVIRLLILLLLVVVVLQEGGGAHAEANADRLGADGESLLGITRDITFIVASSLGSLLLGLLVDDTGLSDVSHVRVDNVVRVELTSHEVSEGGLTLGHRNILVVHKALGATSLSSLDLGLLHHPEVGVEQTESAQDESDEEVHDLERNVSLGLSLVPLTLKNCVLGQVAGKLGVRVRLLHSLSELLTDFLVVINRLLESLAVELGGIDGSLNDTLVRSIRLTADLLHLARLRVHNPLKQGLALDITRLRLNDDSLVLQVKVEADILHVLVDLVLSQTGPQLTKLLFVSDALVDGSKLLLHGHLLVVVPLFLLELVKLVPLKLQSLLLANYLVDLQLHLSLDLFGEVHLGDIVGDLLLDGGLERRQVHL